MIYTLQKFLWKRRQSRRIADEAFQKEAMAVYSETAIEHVLKLKKHDESAIEILKMRIFALQVMLGEATGSPVGFKADIELKNDYEKQRRVRDLEKEVELIDARIKGRDTSIESVKREAEVLRSQAQELWYRRGVFKKKF